MFVSRTAIRQPQSAYVLVANRKLNYKTGRSRIVYIGTTKKGIGRFAVSAAGRADDVLKTHGVKSFDVRVVNCQVEANATIKYWHYLERALLMRFIARFGERPKCNGTGQRMQPSKEFDYFVQARIDAIVDDLS